MRKLRNIAITVLLLAVLAGTWLWALFGQLARSR